MSTTPRSGRRGQDINADHLGPVDSPEKKMEADELNRSGPRQHYDALEHKKLCHVFEAIGYNHHGATYSIDKSRPLCSLLVCGKSIYSHRMTVKIQCVEGVFLGLHLTQRFAQVDRFSMSFESHHLHDTHHHIVLGVHHRGIYGALGISRSKDLMAKDLVFGSLTEMIEDYVAAYRREGHVVVGVKVSEVISPENIYSSVTWHRRVVRIEEDDDAWRKEIAIYCEDVMGKETEHTAVDVAPTVAELSMSLPRSRTPTRSRNPTRCQTPTRARTPGRSRTPPSSKKRTPARRRSIKLVTSVDFEDLISKEDSDRARIQIQQGIDRVMFMHTFTQWRKEIAIYVEELMEITPPAVQLGLMVPINSGISHSTLGWTVKKPILARYTRWGEVIENTSHSTMVPEGTPVPVDAAPTLKKPILARSTRKVEPVDFENLISTEDSRRARIQIQQGIERVMLTQALDRGRLLVKL